MAMILVAAPHRPKTYTWRAHRMMSIPEPVEYSLPDHDDLVKALQSYS